MKILSSGQKCTLVPVVSLVPDSRTAYWGTPILYSCSNIFPSLFTVTRSLLLKAFTQLTPTPCKPPDTLYESLSNLPPACSTVITTSRADFFSLLCMAVGIPRPSSSTEIELSSWILTVIFLQ